MLINASALVGVSVQYFDAIRARSLTRMALEQPEAFYEPVLMHRHPPPQLCVECCLCHSWRALTAMMSLTMSLQLLTPSFLFFKLCGFADIS